MPRRRATDMIASMSAGLPIVWTTMIALVCGVIFDSRSAGSRLNDSSDSAKTGRAPCMTIELKQEYQLQAGRITSSPGPTPRAASAVVSAAVPEVTASAYFVLHPRGQLLLEGEHLHRRLAPGPYQRNGWRFSRTSRSSASSLSS